MTDPTPTRAEVEAFRPETIIPSSDTVILPKSQFKRWCENYQASLRAMGARHFAEEAALRERAEAAERRADSNASDANRLAVENNALDSTLGRTLTAAHRAEAAAWNDAIEAAAAEVESLWAFRTCREVTDAIRALRRAAPTEER